MPIADYNEQALRQFVLEEMDRSALAVRVRQLQGATVTEAHVAPGAMQTPTFAGTWRNFAGGGGVDTDARCWRDVNGVVHLEGLVDKNGGNFTAADPILTLPVGYRPAKNLIFGAPMSGNGGAGYNVGHVNVLSTGSVTIGAIGGPSNPVYFVSLAGITFKGV